MQSLPVHIAVLDACVLYPATLRDFLLQLAEQDAFGPKWSDEIIHEFVRGVLRDRPGVKPERLQRTVELMNDAFPDARVTGHGRLVTALTLPDPDDRHVLAAAIRAKATSIVTLNLKDFPAPTLAQHGIVAVHPDAFVAGVLKAAPQMVEQAFVAQQQALKNPPVLVADLLDKLEQQGLKDSMRLLRVRLAEK